MTKKNGSEGRLHIGSFQMGEESFPSSPCSPTSCLSAKTGDLRKSILALTVFLHSPSLLSTVWPENKFKIWYILECFVSYGCRC